MTQSANYIGTADPAVIESPEAPAAQSVDSSADASTSLQVGSKRPVNRTTAALLLLVALAGGGFSYMHWRTGPQAASAATVSTDAATADKTIGQFLSTGPSSMKVMAVMLHSTEKVVQQFNNYPSVRQVPLSALQTNPFRQSTANAQESNEAQRQAVQKAYESLQLQSIMHADKNSSCLINNTLYREGQLVNGFSIEKINADNVSIKQADWRFELKMQK